MKLNTWRKLHLSRTDESQRPGDLLRGAWIPIVIAFTATALLVTGCKHGSPEGASHPSKEKAPTVLCAPCQEICKLPILVIPKMFEPYHSFEVSRLPKVLQIFETAGAMDSAKALQAAYGQYNGGNFGSTYKIHESGILSLAKKKSAEEPASEHELKALKRVLTALYADTATSLGQISLEKPTPKFLVAYKENEGSIGELISKVSPDYEMSPEQQVAVRRVLSAYAGSAQIQPTDRMAEIIDQKLVYSAINETNCLRWPSAEAKGLGGKNGWGAFSPQNGDKGVVVAEGFHCRSAEEIYILKIGDYYVPVASGGVRLLEGEAQGR